MSDKSCPSCGMTIESVRKHGLIGCEFCLREFRSEIVMQFRRSGHGFNYSGKMPLSIKNNELTMLGKELESAVNNDDFERAAILRDSINKIQADAAK